MDYCLLHSSVEAVEEQAEAFVLGHLNCADHCDYECHLLVCAMCRNAVDTVTEFVEVFREVLAHSGPAQPATMRARSM